jgi:hypothetical protein
LPGLSFILLKRKPKPARKPKAKKAEDVVTEKLTPPSVETEVKKGSAKAKKASAAKAEEPVTELEKLVAENKAKKAKKIIKK